jgi:hypothetical protein
MKQCQVAIESMRGEGTMGSTSSTSTVVRKLEPTMTGVEMMVLLVTPRKAMLVAI